MNYLGDYADNSVVKMYFTTHDKDGAAVAPSSAFENTDIRIYKDGSATQKTSVNGIVMTSPFDVLVGLHLLSIDTGNDTGDVGFWAVGSEYSVILIPDETIDGELVIKVIGSFSIERAGGAIALTKVVDGIVDDILLDTAEIGVAGAGLTNINLPNQTMDIIGSITGNLSGTVGSVTALSAAAVDSILDETVEGALTLRHITKILLSYMAGRSTGGGTVTVSFKDQANTKNRIVMTVNADGNRSNVVVDGT
jgi:hypothetical protein